MLLFIGSSYRMFKHSSSAFASAEIAGHLFPAGWNNKLDGAVNWDKRHFIFFTKEYIIYNTATDSVIDHNDANYMEWMVQQWTTGIDDAFNIGDGFIYFCAKEKVCPIH